jgi:hypothetical protein
MAQEGYILTGNQLVALRKKKETQECIVEIESYHPGYLLSQNT